MLRRVRIEMMKADCRGVMFAIEIGGHYWRNIAYLLKMLLKNKYPNSKVYEVKTTGNSISRSAVRDNLRRNYAA